MRRSDAVQSMIVLAAFLAAVFVVGAPCSAQEARIKDLVNIRGVRTNQLIGFGLVIGLRGTGDTKKSLTTNQAAATLLSHLGQKSKAEDFPPGSVAAVITTADLPPFARIGDAIDVRVSAIGDAKSLAGGTLIMTPLRAGDNEIYAMVQGSVVVGQANGGGAQVLTVARVPLGGIVEKEFIPNFAPDGVLTLSLKQADFTTNARLTDVINEHFRGFFAVSKDPSTIEVSVPRMFQPRVVEFISELERLTVNVDRKAVVVLNERTGTVVMGNDVTISKITITHGDLSIQVGKGADKKSAKSVAAVDGTTVGKLVETLNGLGVKPADLVGILQAIHAAGALQAELKFL